MNTGRASGIVARILLGTCLAFAPSGCKEADTVTGVQLRPTPQPSPPPSPTPPPAPASIAGTWTGTSAGFYYHGGRRTCESRPVGAIFQHSSGVTAVTATFDYANDRCGAAPFRLSGDYSGGVLTGTAAGWLVDAGADDPYNNAIVSGFVRSDGILVIRVTNASSPRFETTFDLQR